LVDPSLLPPPIAALLDPRAYPDPPLHVELLQTHISYVFLAGAVVYKVKKPVRFAFLDFSTLALRRHFCAEEVRLNRRLAPGVYLDVRAVRQTTDGYAIGPADAPDAVEYAVHMRRLPADRLLSAMLANGTATPAWIERIAAKLAAFHAAADAGPTVARGGDPHVIAALLDRDFREVDALHGETISADDDAAIRDFCHGFLVREDALLRRRQAEGRIRDGHGDLHADHICCTEDLPIFDCIEFNAEFRHRDVAADLAFLSMDLEMHRRPDLAAHLVARYAAHAGDRELASLIPFYACQRAYIRGKVETLTSGEPEVDAATRAAARTRARAHFALAYRYTWAYTPLLVVVVGLSGSGKTSIAAALHDRTGFVHINSDLVRKQLARVPPTARPGPTLYTPGRNAATYRSMYARAARVLSTGQGAIIDATFQRRADREQARAIARAAGVPVVFVECVCPEDEVYGRLAARVERDDDASDADWAVYQQQRAQYQPFGAHEGDHCAVDTTRPRAAVLAAIEARLRAAAEQAAP
jgi:aminoglycoside phosphotransferase family enzyme/predicted kinase